MIKYETRHDLMSDEFPEVWIEAKSLSKESENVVIGTCYRELQSSEAKLLNQVLTVT